MELKFPRLTCVAIILVLTPISTFGVFLTTVPNIVARLVGAIFLCFIALAVVGSFYGLVRNKPFVVINDDGIEDVRLKIGIITWDDIRSLEVKKLKGLFYICIDLHVPEKFFSRLPTWTQHIIHRRHPRDFGILSINIGNLRPSSKEVMQYSILRHPELYRDSNRS